MSILWIDIHRENVMISRNKFLNSTKTVMFHTTRTLQSQGHHVRNSHQIRDGTRNSVLTKMPNREEGLLVFSNPSQ